METWQLVSVVASVVVAGVGVLGLQLRATGKLDTKINELAKENHSLSREFSELRGTINERFQSQDRQAVTLKLDEGFESLVDLISRESKR